MPSRGTADTPASVHRDNPNIGQRFHQNRDHVALRKPWLGKTGRMGGNIKITSLDTIYNGWNGG
jgi:hypothetical protein